MFNNPSLHLYTYKLNLISELHALLMSRQILEQITAEEIIQNKTFQSKDLHQFYKT